MDYVQGNIFNSFDKVPPDQKGNAAFSLGESAAVFNGIVGMIPEDEWKTPLPNFHDLAYHLDYMYRILEGEEIPLSLSQSGDKTVRLDADIMAAIKDGYFSRLDSIYGSNRTDELPPYVPNVLKHCLLVQAVRFFADSLVGNMYYKKKGQSRGMNLHRALVQMKQLDLADKATGN